jgi:hypothetical protein
VAYTCTAKGKTISVCQGAKTIVYRYGALGHPELEVVSTGADGKAHLAKITGGGDGSQTSVRFSNAGYEYVVYSAVLGSLTDHPGEASSGVVVMQGDNEVSTIDCPESGPRQHVTVLMSVEEETEEWVLGWL